MNSYIEIEFEHVDGYSKLSENAKKVFERVYKAHNRGHGLDYKKNWIPSYVKEHREYLKVHFINGEWLHYCPNGEWY